LHITGVFPFATNNAVMPASEGAPRTLYDKVFKDHIVDERLDGTILLYIGMPRPFGFAIGLIANFCKDRHLVHEVTSPVRLPYEIARRILTQHSKLLKA
jgi:hypothetical protein